MEPDPRHAEYMQRVAELETEGCDTSDAQSIADVEFRDLPFPEYGVCAECDAEFPELHNHDCQATPTPKWGKSMESPTESAYWQIMKSDIFRLNGQPIDLPAALLELAEAVKEEEETDWNLGEHTEAPLDALIIGAYWTLTQWHAGQFSPEYAALCALGSIYSPGMSDGPEEGSAEEIAAEMLKTWFENKYPSKP